MSEPTIEERARQQGWVPQEEFRGPEDNWVDAETFVERGENSNAILRERMAKLERELIETKKTSQDFLEFHKQTEARAYQAARDDLVKEQAKAIEGGDGDAFAKLEKDKQALDTEHAQKSAPSPEMQPEFIDFKSRNSWYESDPDMTAFADGISGRLLQEGYQGKALLDQVEVRAKQAFPHKFEEGGGEQPQMNTFGMPRNPVEGGGTPQKRGGGNKKNFDNLPADAKEQYERFAKQFGKDKDGNPNFTKEQYVKDYQWD